MDKNEKYIVLCEMYIQLYEKYVDANAMFQVNLPHHLLKSLTHFYMQCQLDKFNNDKNVFQNNALLLEWWSCICSAGRELLTLIKHSQERFEYYDAIQLQVQKEKMFGGSDITPASNGNNFADLEQGSPKNDNK